MDVVVVTPRTDEMIPLGIVKAYLRVDHEDHDDLIQTHLDAAIDWLDGPTGWLGRSLGAQTLRVEVAGFAALAGLELPLGPVSAIDAITWRDNAGLEQAVDDDLYEVVANRVRLVSGASWPASASGVITVDYQAGYDPAVLPAPIRSAILMQVKIQYDKLDEDEIGALERSRDALLSPFRLRRV